MKFARTVVSSDSSLPAVAAGVLKLAVSLLCAMALAILIAVSLSYSERADASSSGIPSLLQQTF